jgi:hypothetical protein
MSTLKVDGIRSNSATSDAITLASDGTCTANITNNLSNRNKIINGDFTVHQRGGTITASSGLYTLDRWRSYITGTSPGGFTVQQSTGSYPQTSISGVKDNFKASVLITVTSAGSASADNNVKFQQRIEGTSVYDLAFGTAAAKKVTVSFYVKCSITGTFGIALVNENHNRSNVQTYTVNSANTWERKIITFDGDTSGTWAFNTGTGMQLMFDLGSGSDKHASSTGTWLSSEKHGTSSSTKLIHTNGATIQFTGVQLEAGSVATDFEHRSYSDELRRCQRYYFKRTGGNGDQMCLGYAESANRFAFMVNYPVPMRQNPSFTGSATSVRFYSNNPSNTFNMNQLVVFQQPTTPNPEQGALWREGTSGATAGQGGALQTYDTSTSTMEFSAEL